MKFYLSSYKIGNEIERLKTLIPVNKKTAFISNAVDYKNDAQKRAEGEMLDMDQLRQVGLDPELLDLRNYFGKSKELKKKLDEFGVIWVKGGNVFVLRQAMKLSGFDDILKDLFDNNANILYGGYSAGICILCPTLKGMELVDSPNENPYNELKEIIWDGLGVVDYQISVHYKSDHPESANTDKEIEYYINNEIAFKALHDGEVIIIE